MHPTYPLRSHLYFLPSFPPLLLGPAVFCMTVVEVIFCDAAMVWQGWSLFTFLIGSLVCPLGTSGLVLTPNSLCNACGLRFLTMVQKEAKVLPSSTAQRVTVCSLVNPPKQAPVPLAPSRSTPTSETYFQVLPSKESSMGPRKAAPMVSATKTTTMRFSWNPPAVRPPKGFTTPSLSNPYMRSAW